MGLSGISLRDTEKVRIDEAGRSVGFFSKSLPVSVDRYLIEELKNASLQAGGKNVRLCLHSKPDSLFHSMIVLENRGMYYRPHKHVEKGECFHIIEGRMGVIAFDDAGETIDACILELGENIIYRVDVNMYHGVFPLTETVVYHESKLGPFLGDKDSIFPAWAPDEKNENRVSQFNEQLLSMLTSL